MKRVKAYRTIFAESLESIDFSNLGRHWTVCEVAAENVDIRFNGITDLDNLEKFIVSAWVNVENIDFHATTVSKENHPEEEECVIDENVELIIEVDGEELKGNTGTRGHEWLDNVSYDHETKKEEILSDWKEWIEYKN